MNTNDRIREAKEKFDICYINSFPESMPEKERNFLKEMGNLIFDLIAEALEGTERIKYYDKKMIGFSYCCPVCQGKGIVPCNFYKNLPGTANTNPQICQSCNGTGIIWGTGELI